MATAAASAVPTVHVPRDFNIAARYIDAPAAAFGGRTAYRCDDQRVTYQELRDQVNRGDIRLFVAFRPDENVSNEVSFTGGYPFREGSTVTLTIGGESFSLGPGAGDSGEWAWTDPSDDARAVAAMRRGSSATITGTSSRGTETEDTFSLSGFTAAVEDAEARCR